MRERANRRYVRHGQESSEHGWRNFVSLDKAGTEGYRIYVQEKAILSQVQGEAYKALNLAAPAPEKSPNRLIMSGVPQNLIPGV